MNGSSPEVLKSHAEILQRTQLGQLCGTKQLFCDRYTILRILGRGGFGVTFLARNAVLPGKPLCVIKQLCPKVDNINSWKRACQRFEKEAKTLAQLGSHSQIPMLLDYFEVSGEFYLVQEYVKGFNLAQEVQRTGLYSEAAVKKLLRELLPVLRYIHKHHVIHRDIKPHNLLRCEDDGRLVLIDFGAVKEELVLKNGTPTDVPANTNFIGTMGFAPPEQLSLRPVYASDIYALGVTCLYLLTEKLPLEFEYDVKTGEICWQKEINVSAYFAQILERMLKLSLEERFKSVDDVIWALDMENHLPTLTDCLTTQRLGVNARSVSEEAEYLTPTERTARAIRDWQTKLKGRMVSG
ncbi:protein kinase [Scytonema sp. UIC 10036]|uniref:serine/threonine-protein kinase n=1 Tax=Scytonema sp. UIC 10036 TaxID=2304196 RepID=UPI0012DA88A5|nr:serine/threonine-protein kinase [Scytonema sp. UIC 10036]MUH01576.1 protein kinase [Scytonema sp. UIC 10036]